MVALFVLLALSVVLTTALQPAERARPHRDVVTGAGVARGYLYPRPPHFAFLGLPYTRPPSRQTRFKRVDPGARCRWDGVLEATYRVRCAQPGARRDAACLVLNVFAPERAAQRPVLVHLHGGHFATGWGSHVGPPRLLSRGIVVVTLNYRLGAEGFLCLGTAGAPGNAGLHDQAAALAWVRANIAAFGGDPARVTLYGTGAGAAAAEFLLLSGAVDGFIQRVILESGSALAPTSLVDDPVAPALDVAKSLGYEDDDAKTTDDLTSFYQNIAIEKTLNFSNRFMPCVEALREYDSALIVKDPKEILQSGILKPVPLLIAYSKERSTLSDISIFYNLPNSFGDLLPNNLKFESDDIKSQIGEQVKESYFGVGTGSGVVEGYERYINDVFTVYPIVKSATLHAAASSLPVYLMEFLPQDGSDTIFEYIFSKETFGEEEELVAEKLVTLWSNFIMYSDPTPLETSLLPLVWSPVSFKIKNEKPDISTAVCLNFDPGQTSMSIGTPSSGHTLPIWEHIYDNFYKSHTPPLDMSESEITIYKEHLALMFTQSEQGTKKEEVLNVDTSDKERSDTEEGNVAKQNGEENEITETGKEEDNNSGNNEDHESGNNDDHESGNNEGDESNIEEYNASGYDDDNESGNEENNESGNEEDSDSQVNSSTDDYKEYEAYSDEEENKESD